MFFRRQQTQAGNMAYLLAQEEREEREAKERTTVARAERDRPREKPVVQRVIAAVRCW